MANLRKLVAAAVNSSNLIDRATVETALDRVRALGFADSLGSALWRLKYGGQAASYKKVVLLLTKRVRKPHEPLAVIARLCEIVVQEYLDGACRSCGGRGVLADGAGVRHVCTACGGTGLRHLSELERIRALGLGEHAYRRWEPRFKAAHDKLANADSRCGAQVSAQLRDAPLTERPNPGYSPDVHFSTASA